MNVLETEWALPGASGEMILGNSHAPESGARGVVLVVHGFLGYKDYGMFPALARSFAEAGFIAHRFNLSHSGMTNAIEMFERPDLFERDTWKKQVFDVQAVVDAIGAGALAGADVPLCLFGHSRGGDTCLLAGAEMFERGAVRRPRAIVTAAAPSALCRMDDAVRAQLLDRGSLDHKSNRTGQTLRIGKAWLADQLDDPAWHDLHARVASIKCPILFVHGQDDPTVPAADADELAGANSAHAATRSCRIPGANHVFGTPNPLPTTEPMPETLRLLVSAAVDFFKSHTS